MRILAVALLLAVAGCEAATASILRPVTGTYTLAAVNGAPVPYNTPEHATYAALTEGVLTVADGSWSQRTLFALKSGGVMTAEIGGTWTATGLDRYQLNADAVALTAIVTDSTLEYQRNGATYRWRRQ